MGWVRIIAVQILTFVSVLVFLASCVITLSDAQGGIVFVFSLPVLVLLLLLAVSFSRDPKGGRLEFSPLSYGPIGFSAFLLLFFTFLMIPGLKVLPEMVFGMVNSTFSRLVGKSPYVFFKERSSFERKLAKAVEESNLVDLSKLDVTFAWDSVCIFGPQTTRATASTVLKLDWNIEERSEISRSQTINALVFLYEGKVNQVTDLKKSLADFKPNSGCLGRHQTQFRVNVGPGGERFLEHVR